MLIIFFFSDYPSITSVEQRRKYKTEFEKDYAEYRQLHLFMDKARRKFATLQEELNAVNSTEQRYKASDTSLHRFRFKSFDNHVFIFQEIQERIMAEYNENKNNNNNTFKDKKLR